MKYFNYICLRRIRTIFDIQLKSYILYAHFCCIKNPIAIMIVYFKFIKTIGLILFKYICDDYLAYLIVDLNFVFLSLLRH